MTFYSFNQILASILPADFDFYDDSASDKDEAELFKHVEGLGDLIDEMEEDVRLYAGLRPNSAAKAIKDFYDDLLKAADRVMDAEIFNIAEIGLQVAALVIRRGGDIEKANQLLKDFCANSARFEAEDDSNNDVEHKHIRLSYMQFAAARLLPVDFNTTRWLHEEAVKNMQETAKLDAGEYSDMFGQFCYSCHEEKKFPGALPILDASYNGVIRHYENIVECCLDAGDRKNAVLNSEILIGIDLMVATGIAEDTGFAARARHNFDTHWQTYHAMDEAEALGSLIRIRDALKNEDRVGAWPKIRSLVDDKLGKIQAATVPLAPKRSAQHIAQPR